MSNYACNGTVKPRPKPVEPEFSEHSTFFKIKAVPVMYHSQNGELVAAKDLPPVCQHPHYMCAAQGPWEIKVVTLEKAQKKRDWIDENNGVSFNESRTAYRYEYVIEEWTKLFGQERFVREIS